MFGKLNLFENNTMNNFKTRRPNNVDPISGYNIRGGNLYFAIPTTANNKYVSLNQNSFNGLVRSHHRNFQGTIGPWNLFNYNLNAVLFKNPYTRKMVRVRDVRVFRAPRN
jgi:hypothetical protein